VTLTNRGTASGKTTLCRKLVEQIGEDIAILEFDNFYKDLPPGVDAQMWDFDHPSSIDFDSVLKCLTDLRNLKPAHTPIYSFVTNARLPDQQHVIKPRKILILEGIFALFDQVLLHLNIRG
jgi:uridine kinase